MDGCAMCCAGVGHPFRLTLYIHFYQTQGQNASPEEQVVEIQATPLAALDVEDDPNVTHANCSVCAENVLDLHRKLAMGV